jgi:eukaryotic-like serine/threonine-protein kinase
MQDNCRLSRSLPPFPFLSGVPVENTRIGPFQILEKLGAHRRHNVYRAVQVEQQRPVALKFITLPPDVQRETALMKIVAEVEVLKALEHPNLVRMLGAGCEGDQVFFAHEIVEGESLAALLARRGRLTVDLVIDFSRQIAGLLEFLHQKEIIHTKLTTDKLIVDADNRIHATDLRLNRSRKRRWDAAKRASLETAAYMSPEQLEGKGATAKSDLYTLGIIMFEMLTGKLPYEPLAMPQLIRDKLKPDVPTPSSMLPNCPAWLDKLVCKLIHPNPASRPHSARAVILMLEQISSVEQNKLSAAGEISKGFSALGAVADRAEAKRALGFRDKKRREVDPENQMPLMQSIGFIIGGLVMVTGLILLGIYWPFGRDYEAMIARADSALKAEEPEQWAAARDLYDRVLENSRDSGLQDRAESGFNEARRKLLMNRLKRGAGLLEREEVHELYAIMEVEKSGKLRDALQQYRRFADRLEESDDMQHVELEVLDRVAALSEIEAEANSLLGKIEQLEKAVAAPGASDADKKAFEEATAEINSRKEFESFLKPDESEQKSETDPDAG